MKNKRFLLVLALMLVLSALIAGPIRADSITVADGAVVVADNSVCSLIEAIDNANDTTTGLVHDDCAAGDPAGADTIILPVNGSFILTAGVSMTNFSSNGLPLIASEMTIDGNGSTIARDSAAPVFRIMGVNPSGDLTLNDVILSGGRVIEDSAGAIFNWGTLAINNSTVTENSAEGGGAIYNGSTGDVTITDSTLSNNSGMVGVAAGVGGAAWNSGMMTIEGSMIADNFATNLGGGLHNASGAILTMTNSTIYSNWAQFGPAGGLYNVGTATLINITVTENAADTDGGGLFNANLATITLSRSLLSGNYANFSANEIVNLVGSTIYADDYNLFGHSGAANVTGFAPGLSDLVPAEALDDILNTTAANNGGPTMTNALVAGSPAIDAAPSADCAAPPVDVDQRGLPRAVDGDGGASTDECDVGAHEAQGVPVNPLLYVSPLTAGSAGGVAVTPQDIVAQDLSDDSWAMYFDGSDVGVVKILSAFTFLPDGDILMSFKANQVIAGMGTFTPWDVARFTPSSLGTTTAGTFTWYVDGSDVGLTTSAEKIDALDVLADGRVLVSTGGTLAVPKPGGGTLKSQDEDLTALTVTSVGATTSGTWALYFDGTAVPGLGAEDVAGAHVDEATGDLYLSIVGAFKVGGISGNGKDVLKLTPAGGGYTVTMYWHGGNNGFNLNLGGIEFP